MSYPSSVCDLVAAFAQFRGYYKLSCPLRMMRRRTLLGPLDPGHRYLHWPVTRRVRARVIYGCLRASRGLSRKNAVAARVSSSLMLNRHNGRAHLQVANIVEDLKSWHAQLVKDAPHRVGQLPEIDISVLFAGQLRRSNGCAPRKSRSLMTGAPYSRWQLPRQSLVPFHQRGHEGHSS